MKSFRTILMGTIVAGLLLFSVNGAMAAYTGTYVNDNNSSLFVDLGAGSFSINGGSPYAVTDLSSTLWSATGATDYYYGANLSDGFGFINSPTALDSSAVGTITGAVSTFVTLSIAALPMAQIMPAVFESLINGYINNLLGTLSQYNLEGALVGYGSFAADGNSFDVTTGTLDAAGLRSLICEDCSETYTATPIPGAIWLLGSGLVGLVGLRRRMRG